MRPIARGDPRRVRRRAIDLVARQRSGWRNPDGRGQRLAIRGGHTRVGRRLRGALPRQRLEPPAKQENAR